MANDPVKFTVIQPCDDIPPRIRVWSVRTGATVVEQPVDHTDLLRLGADIAEAAYRTRPKPKSFRGTKPPKARPARWIQAGLRGILSCMKRGEIMNAVFQRLAEPSTWAGFAAFAAAFGVAEAEWATISAALTGVFGVVAMAVKEKGSA